MSEILTAELFAELRPSLEAAMRVIARKNGEEIEDGFPIPQIILDVADSCTLLLTYIDALTAENADLKAGLAAADRLIETVKDYRIQSWIASATPHFKISETAEYIAYEATKLEASG